MSFEEWLTQTFPIVHPHIKEYFQMYCWSSFAGSIDELSAAQVLNFVAAEVDGVMALPGGNALICQKIYDELKKNWPSQNLQSGAIVIKIKQRDDHKIWITFENSSGELKTLECHKAIVATPKFVTKRIVDGLSDEYLSKLNRISYRGYLVTNALFAKEKTFQSPAYDVFILKGEAPPAPSAFKQPASLTADVIFSSWAQDDQVNQSVLTMYRPIAFDGGRQFLFNPDSHEKHRKKSMNELQVIAEKMQIDLKNLIGLRQTRWGHSLPLARKGFISEGLAASLIEPQFKNIRFANQDNWANPAFECCFTESFNAVHSLKAQR